MAWQAQTKQPTRFFSRWRRRGSRSSAVRATGGHIGVTPPRPSSAPIIMMPRCSQARTPHSWAERFFSQAGPSAAGRARLPGIRSLSAAQTPRPEQSAAPMASHGGSRAWTCQQTADPLLCGTCQTWRWWRMKSLLSSAASPSARQEPAPQAPYGPASWPWSTSRPRCTDTRPPGSSIQQFMPSGGVQHG